MQSAQSRVAAGQGDAICKPHRAPCSRARGGRVVRAAAAPHDPSQPSTSGGSGAGRFFQPGQEASSREQLFNRISPIYDELNDRLSLGRHKVWKRRAVGWTGARPGNTVLDVCCGSGDLAFELASAVGPRGKVVGLDFAANMLTYAAERERGRAASFGRLGGSYDAPGISWVQGDALALPFGDGEFDAVTMGYGLRNVADIPKALRELRRVLRPGGTAAVLDFNHSDNPVVDALQGWVLDNVVVPTARSYGLEEEYAYLRPSIAAFPTGPQLERLAAAAGFARAQHRLCGGGAMGCLVATR